MRKLMLDNVNVDLYHRIWAFYMDGDLHEMWLNSSDILRDGPFSLGSYNIFIDENKVRSGIRRRFRGHGQEFYRFAYEGHIFVLNRGSPPDDFDLSIDGQNIPHPKLGFDKIDKMWYILVEGALALIEIKYSWNKGLIIYQDDKIIHQDLYPEIINS